VRRVPAADEKPLHWVGSAKRDFLSFPAAVKEDMGNALGIAQFGGTAPTAKP
jgi:phage-related protein